MHHLFDQTDKSVKILSSDAGELRIKQVLNPFDQTFVDEARAKELGIIFNGYYRNNYGGLIPLRIAANKGFIELADDDRVQIEYHSAKMPIITRLTIHHVYDGNEQSLISCRQAIDRGYLHLRSLTYSNANGSMFIHEAFGQGLIIGEVRTTMTDSKATLNLHETRGSDYDDLFSSLTNMINSLSEFRNTVHITEQCELTSDGRIRETKTGSCYLLTEAVERGLVSIKDSSRRNQLDQLNNQSIIVNETNVSKLDSTSDDDDEAPYFSETFIHELSNGMDDVSTETCRRDGRHSLMTKLFLPSINTC